MYMMLKLMRGDLQQTCLVEEGHAVAYFGGSKEEVQMKHMANREKLLREEVVSKADFDEAVAIHGKRITNNWTKTT